MGEAKTRVLITGGSGFAGSHLAERLAQHPAQYELHATHVAPVPADLTALLPTVVFHQLDLADGASVRSLLHTLQPTQIYQLASLAGVGDSFANAAVVLAANTTILLNLLEAIRLETPTARTLVITSAEVYGQTSAPDTLPIKETNALRPVNPYGVSKVTQDLLADCYQRAYQLPIIRVRPFNHIGERQQAGFAVTDFAKQVVAIERGQAAQLRVGNLTPERDFTDVKDMVAGYQLLMEQGTPGDVYNLGSGSPVSIQTVVDALCRLASVPISVVPDQSKYRPADITRISADATKARALGWQPQISLEQSLERILGYWRSI